MLSPSEQSPLLLDPAPLLSAIVRDLRGRVPVDRIAGQFHSAVVDAMVVVALRARASDDDTGLLNTVVLGGGVFQNARLLGEAVRRLRAEEFEVLVPVRLPPNDGGLALGQTLIAGAR
jgi:hydrogenase maturation protein HypF